MIASACGGGGSTPQGGERQACYPNDTCNIGLTCASKVCVNLGGNGGAGGRGGAQAGGMGGSGDSAGGGTGGSPAGGAGGVSGTGGTGGPATGGTSGAAGGRGGAGGVSGTGGTGGNGGSTGGGASGAGGAGGTSGIGGASGTGGTSATAGTGGAAGSTAGAGGTGGPPPCRTSASYGNLGNVTTPDADPGPPLTWYFPLEAGTPSDQLGLELFAGLGVFEAGLQTGTFAIAGAELDYSTCGLCVVILENASATGARGTYLATGGTVTLTSITGKLTGTMSDVTFEHVTIDPTTFESSPHPDGCRSAVTRIGFNVDLPP